MACEVREGWGPVTKHVQHSDQDWLPGHQVPVEANCRTKFCACGSRSLKICQTKIKQQAREHERFRRVCVRLAQGIHQWDMRFRLGLLQDQAAIDRQIAREAAESQSKKHRHEHEGPKTEAEAKAEEAAAAKAKEEGTEKPKEPPKRKPKIRPLSEAKAIDSGANFVSESFLLVVAVGCVVGERWYSSKKENSRREDVAERLSELEEYDVATRKGLLSLEKEIIRLRNKQGAAEAKRGRILPREVYDVDEKEDEQTEESKSWLSWIPGFGRSEDKMKAQPRPEAEEPEEKPADDATLPHDPSPTLYERIIHPVSANKTEESTPKLHVQDGSERASQAQAASTPKEGEDKR